MLGAHEKSTPRGAFFLNGQAGINAGQVRQRRSRHGGSSRGPYRPLPHLPSDCRRNERRRTFRRWIKSPSCYDSYLASPDTLRYVLVITRRANGA